MSRRLSYTMQRLESQAESVIRDYLNPDIPVLRLCDMYNVSQNTFYRWIKDKNLPPREAQTPAKDRIDAMASEVLEKYLEQGTSIIALAREIGVAPVAMRAWMKGRGITIRGSYEAQIVRRKAEVRETTFAEQEAVRLYVGTRMPVLEIEKTTGVPIYSLYKQLRESGIPLRTDAEETVEGEARETKEPKAKKKHRKLSYTMQRLESQAESLIRDYLNPDIPVLRLCDMYNVSQDTFYRWVKDNNLPRREAKTPARDRIDAVATEVLDRYLTQGVSIVALSREVGVAPVAMRAWMKARGITLRGSYEAQIVRRKAEGRETTFADEEAIRLYAGTQMPVLEIEKTTGVPIYYLYKQLRDSGIPLRTDAVETLDRKAKERKERRAKKKLSASARLWAKRTDVEHDIENGMTISDLSWKYGVSEITVSRWKHNLNLGSRKGLLTPKQKRIVGAWHETDLNMYGIAKRMGYSYSTVRDTLSKVGLRQPGHTVGRPPGKKMGQR